MSSQTVLLQRLRRLANDSPTSNFIKQETPKGTRDGSNKNFRLENQNVVETSVCVTTDSVFRSQSGFTVAPFGVLIFAVAPSASSKLFEVDYNYYVFTDADHADFLTDAAELLSYSDPAAVPDGLIPALLQYGLYYFWKRRASAYAARYASTGGQVGHSVDEVSKQFLNLAKSAYDEGTKQRDDFYKRQGQREAPSVGSVSYGIDPYTPKR